MITRVIVAEIVSRSDVPKDFGAAPVIERIEKVSRARIAAGRAAGRGGLATAPSPIVVHRIRTLSCVIREFRRSGIPVRRRV